MRMDFSVFQYRDDILWLTAFILGGLSFALGPILLVYLLMPRKTRQVSGRRDQYIECGMDPIGDSWIRYGIVFYLYALIFLAFDVDVLFLFPVVLAYNDEMFVIRDLIEIVLFVGILSLAVVYAWVKGVFKWERKTYRRP
ncbi:NADH-quinone oxidoreductase subunit A [Desulfofustis limnaeus]|uniref:NADH-quinone oxidoreductase subunit n=2 Tax=Desulfofustis limnaeus TaxID=2740163 RepID=A0ABM7W751_9BACT|nr:NADH-quinone oxidoreductase subunit A [Desulfofustis limnaeus]